MKSTHVQDCVLSRVLNRATLDVIRNNGCTQLSHVLARAMPVGTALSFAQLAQGRGGIYASLVVHGAMHAKWQYTPRFTDYPSPKTSLAMAGVAYSLRFHGRTLNLLHS